MVGGLFRRLSAYLLLLLLCQAVYAYQLSPLSVTYEPIGSKSAAVYTIVNDSDNPIAVQFRAAKRSIDIYGTEYNDDASAYFSIQPAKMIIRPQSSQLVRVQYRGPRTVTKELSFRLISEQISYSPGAKEKTEGQMLSFLFVYSTSAYVRPSRIVERVSSSASIADGKIVIKLDNEGSVHQLLNEPEIRLTGDDGSVYTLSEEQLLPISGKNLLVDSSLVLEIEIPPELRNAREIAVSHSYTYRYE